MRRAGQLAVDHAAHLCELLHQVMLGVEPPGGIADDHVEAAGARRLHGVERHRAGVCSLRPTNDVAARSLTPGHQLLDGGGAEGVGRAEHHGAAKLVVQVPRDLADRRGLPRAVDAHHQDHGRVVAQVDRVLACAGGVGEQLPQPARERLASSQAT